MSSLARGWANPTSRVRPGGSHSNARWNNPRPSHFLHTSGANPPRGGAERACGAPLSEKEARTPRSGPLSRPGLAHVRGRIVPVQTPDVDRKLESLHGVLAATGGVVVAYSGGTDSALVAAVAAREL